MMSLAPPYYIFEGVPVLADAEDPLQWYYLPNRPHFATDEQNRPAVRFLVLKANLDEVPTDQEHAVGFLIFDTSLAWPEATLARVAQKIENDRNLDGPPRLVPLLFKSGTCRLMFLDKMTPDPNAKTGTGNDPGTQAPPTDNWVTMLETSGVPSLYGENRAIFSATLTKQATELLYGAFDGFVPAGVVYDLDFVGLQPAFHIHVVADWNQVFNYVKEKHSTSIIFFSSDVEKTVQSLIDTKTIVFEAAIEGVGDEGMEGQFNEVRKQLLDFVLNTFFKPTANPFQPDTAVQDGIIGTLTALRDLGNPIHCGYQRIEIDASELRTLNIDYAVSRAVERKIAPQAHLSMFFSDYNLTKDQVVTVVNGADDFWKEADFSVQTSAGYTVDGISAVSVDVAYGQPTPPPDNASLWSFVFKDTNTVAKKAAWYDPTVGDTVQYRYQVVFNSSVAGPEIKLPGPWQESRGGVVLVAPDELYLRRSLEFQLDSLLPLNQYPEVQVELRYTHAATGWTHQDSTVLTGTARTWNPTFRIHRDWDPTIDYRLTYFHSAGQLGGDWQSTSQSSVLVPDPRKNLFPVHLLVAGQRDQISQIVVDLRYTDADNDIFETTSFTLDKTSFDQPHDWAFPRADPAKNRYTYSQVIIDSQGNAIMTGEVESDQNILLVGPLYARRWTVQPELVGPPLADNGVAQVIVALHYEDPANAVVSEQTDVFFATGPGQGWQLQLKDPSQRQYSYTVTYTLMTGFVRVLGPLVGSDTFLVISSIPPAQ
jgi:hypothetical protein